MKANEGVKLRLVALGLTIGLVGAAIMALVLNFQRQSDELQSKLATIDRESGAIAAQFKDALRELNNTQLQYAISHDPVLWQQFLDLSRQLNRWLDQETLKLTSQKERDALEKIKMAFMEYIETLSKLPNEAATSMTIGEVLEAFTRARSESQHLSNLGQDLVRAHSESRTQLLAEANEHLQSLRWSVLVLLGLLFVFGVALAMVAYRDMIAPLRMQLVESRQLAERHEKLASLGMLAAGVAHEIRNPLTAIKAALFIQQKRFAPNSPERADVDLVQREIARLEKIVSDFLRFARPSEPELAVVFVDELLTEVRRFFAPELEKAGLHLVLDAPAPCKVNADAAQMKQVLINLVQNAVESCEPGGTITLRARRDRKPLTDVECEVVVIEVADTGKGMTPEVVERLFDPFFTTKDYGTGLGLSIAARIVEKHSGALQYQTQLNRGTTFGIVLPHALS